MVKEYVYYNISLDSLFTSELNLKQITKFYRNFGYEMTPIYIGVL
jgi:hypothetical protein